MKPGAPLIGVVITPRLCTMALGLWLFIPTISVAQSTTTASRFTDERVGATAHVMMTVTPGTAIWRSCRSCVEGVAVVSSLNGVQPQLASLSERPTAPELRRQRWT